MDYDLTPKIDVLKSEPVLVQAWKKTSNYIRYHNWYADTLEIDYQSIRLPSFLNEIKKDLDINNYCPKPLQLVPAPKSQKWEIRQGKLVPREVQDIKNKMRPLSHVDLKDQVIATALMLCLANNVESLQGDPTLNIYYPENRREVVSYGNRLFCDNTNGYLQHRWGSAKTYRQYYTDYQTFLNRPETVVKQCKHNDNGNFEYAIIQSDLSKFYDRVRPALLISAIKKNFEDINSTLLKLIEKIFSWEWDKSNKLWIEEYADNNEIDDFNSIALPQGLVSAGFYANLVLLDFDDHIRNFIGEFIAGNYQILDYCRYVDDIRIVAKIPKRRNQVTIDEINSNMTSWLQNCLDITAHGLKAESSKTRSTVEGREDQVLVLQSKAANRIQRATSCTLDMLKGTELITAIEGFFFSQNKFSQNNAQNVDSMFSRGISDIHDDTAARFAAGKFRKVFRSLRPMLDSESMDEKTDGFSLPNLVLSKEQLDERAELFSLMLIERWVEDPSNIRLVRIALDLYPCEKCLAKILNLLRDGWQDKGTSSSIKEVKAYCLAEIYRAAAVETGMTDDEDCLPENCDMAQYYRVLTDYAKQILKSRNKSPWYLIQQIYLYLISQNQISTIAFTKRNINDNLSLYRNFITFLNGREVKNSRIRCYYSALAYSAFGLEEVLYNQKPSNYFIKSLANNAPGIVMKYWGKLPNSEKGNFLNEAKQNGLVSEPINDIEKIDIPSLCNVEMNPFLNEINLLYLANSIVDHLNNDNELYSPWQIYYSNELPFNFENAKNIGEIALLDDGSFEICQKPRVAEGLFQLPIWVQTKEHKVAYTLGMMLRFALIGNINFYATNYHVKKVKHNRYATPTSHWLQKQYGNYNGRKAFAPDWIPMSSWMESFFLSLLQWPGCKTKNEINFKNLKNIITSRIKELKTKTGNASNLLFLEQDAPLPYKLNISEWKRSLRIGIIQSVIPNEDTFFDNLTDIELSKPDIRRKHRQHLVSVMSGIEQMLRIRITHLPQDENCSSLLDLLIFPELSVHPEDVQTVLLPFVRRYRCIVLCGLVFHKLNNTEPNTIINTALWLIPEWTPANGLQVKQIQQGKQHLTEKEQEIEGLISFRPAQWILNYEWGYEMQPLKISAAVCYDSTDLALASDLKSKSDLFIVCAHNRDVGTFDRMSESLHYHMYQGIVIVNNGKFGGSNLYVPYKESYDRQVLHVHGQPQAQISFAEINPPDLISRGSDKNEGKKWKTPPADWKLRSFFD